MTFNLLEKINNTSDIKNMSISELHTLSDEIRRALIFNVSNTGGHLASNLGVVELTVALHKVFDSPNDKIVFDVGHQCYVHKMLTGRFDKFNTLRQKNGLSGFPNPSESEHDFFKTGHSSTSISSALGLACADSLMKNDTSCVAVIGDGSLTGGLAYEGLNNAGHSKKNIIVVLNDNKMSISENVGAISKVITRLRNKNSYFVLKDFFANLILHIPFIGDALYRRLVKIKSALKPYFYSSNIFESMGFKYIGPVDGHNIELLIKILSRAKSLKCPVLVHVKTIKGKGYSYAENSPRDFHGVGEFDIGTGVKNDNSQLTFSDVFGNTIVGCAKDNDKICAITAAMGDSCGLTQFKYQFPNRYFDVGIAEQHAVTFASGLAKQGFIPVFVVYSTFLQRAYDQIIHDISLQRVKVIFCIDRAGVVGSDGETHQGLFDVPMLLTVPDIKVFSPATGTELDKCIKKCIDTENVSCFIRYPKDKSIRYVNGYFKDSNFDWDIINNSGSVAVISYGREIFDVIDATKDLGVDIIKLNLINKFNDDIINKLLLYKKILFVEEGYARQGVGTYLKDVLYSRGYNGGFSLLGIDECYVPHASATQIKKDYGLDSKSIRKYIQECVL